MRSATTDGDLHLVVDGQVGGPRRSDLLQRIGGDPVRRERLRRWQEQADELRSAFAGVLDEAVPLALDPRTPACLHLVSRSTGMGIHPRASGGSAVPWRTTRPAQGAFGALLGAALVVLGLGCAWTAGRLGPLAGADHFDWTSSMAYRAVAALMPVARDGEVLPTTTIPDLGALGFTLRGIEVERHAPASLVFHYRDAEGAMATVSVSIADAAEPPASAGAIAWRAAGKTVTVAGPLSPARLALIADIARDAIR